MTGHEAPIDVLYVVGIGRSGSTLLGRALGEVEGHFPAGEIKHLFDRGIAGNETCSCSREARACPFWGEVIRHLREGGGLEDPEAASAFSRSIMKGAGAPLVFAPWQPPEFRRRLRAFRELVAQAYETVWEASGRRTLVDTSKNLAWAKLLLEIPRLRVRFVHLIRDSRGVAHSFEKVRRRPGDPDTDIYMDRYHAVTTSLLWDLDNVLAERLRTRAAGYTRLRYRDFVAEPGRSLAAVLGDGHRPEGLEHVKPEAIRISDQHILAGNPMRFDVGRVRLREDVEWREAMSPAKKGVVTVLTSPLLRRYGYLGDGARGRDGAGGRSGPRGGGDRAV